MRTLFDSAACRTTPAVLVAAALSASVATAETGIQFDNLADDPASGLAYQRARSPSFAVLQGAREASLIEPIQPGSTLLPVATGGFPGVALFDHDGDGDLDIYASNGPGATNSLFSSQRVETGALSFIDRGAASGTGATEQNSTGVCFGDLDNDGDPDLIVLGMTEPNRLFENLGGGQFVARETALTAGSSSSTSCSVGDIDGDGLLDVVIANLFDLDVPPPPAPQFDLFEANELYRNLGGLQFEDISEISGIRDLAALPLEANGRTVTWAAAIVDVDADGDADIVFADDQGPVLTAANGGTDIGFLHVLLGDGTGHFVDQPIASSAISAGSWMGLGFGDFNCDGHLDILGSNFGDYGFGVLGLPYVLGDQASRWFLGQGDGTFVDPGLGSGQSSAFAWGNAVADIDNDGDPDMAYQGGLDVSFALIADNPGVVVRNDGCGDEFTVETAPLRGDYTRRNVHGMASGDLDGDGFIDLVTVSNLTVPEALPLLPIPMAHGTVLDSAASFASVFVPTPEGLVWSGVDFGLGTLTVEMSSGDNGNGWATARLVGSTGLTPSAAVNRDGIGAIVSFTPHQGATVTQPIVGGSSHLSQHALEAHFGLGSAAKGTLEVLWPGGVRNRIYGVHHGERVTLPEIPCSFDGDFPNLGSYAGCVATALTDLRQAGVIHFGESLRLFVSALIAFLAEA
ncbi:MAG: CRTAC1 family protein [Acidobacteriota bacterium]